MNCDDFWIDLEDGTVMKVEKEILIDCNLVVKLKIGFEEVEVWNLKEEGKLLCAMNSLNRTLSK